MVFFIKKFTLKPEVFGNPRCHEGLIAAPGHIYGGTGAPRAPSGQETNRVHGLGKRERESGWQRFPRRVLRSLWESSQVRRVARRSLLAAPEGECLGGSRVSGSRWSPGLSRCTTTGGARGRRMRRRGCGALCGSSSRRRGARACARMECCAIARTSRSESEFREAFLFQKQRIFENSAGRDAARM